MFLSGIFPSLCQIWREEGVKGYFKGNGTNVVRIVPYVAVQFAAYEEFKQVGVVIRESLQCKSILMEQMRSLSRMFKNEVTLRSEIEQMMTIFCLYGIINREMPREAPT